MKTVPIIQSDVDTFKSNPRLKKLGQQIPLTQEQVVEYSKCAVDPEYFIENYIEIVTSDQGVIQFKLRDYQRKMVRKMHKYNRVVACQSRQSGKCLLLNTPIRVRNKISGEILETTIGEFYDRQIIEKKGIL